MKLTRRHLLKRLALFGTPVAAFGYGSLVEKRWLDLTRREVPLQPQHQNLHGCKIAVLGDFHHDDYGDNRLIARAVEVINEEQVDFVMLVGDYISSDANALEPLCEELRNLRSAMGVFGVLGNHDRWHFDRRILTSLSEAGVRLLINEVAEFDSFAIGGIDSIWGGGADPERTFEQLSRDKPLILGWHEPDTFDFYQDKRVVLQLSGHTHGGQVCAPAFGPILLPEFGKNYPYDLYEKDGSSLFVTRGIGTITIPTRFLCAPEVAILTLRDMTRSVE